MTKEDQWTYDVFGFGMALNFYLRRAPWPDEESFSARLVRTLREIADGETSINPTDAELRLGLSRTQLPEEIQKMLLDQQPAARAKQKAIATNLVELLTAQPNSQWTIR
jgi:hypothetical protein